MVRSSKTASENTTNMVDIQGLNDDTASAELQNAITFTGMIKKGKDQATEEILAPKSRNDTDSWREEHLAHIKDLKKKQFKYILL